MMFDLLAVRAKKLFYVSKHRRLRKALCAQRVAPSFELVGVLSGVRPKTVIDVGANRGQFSLLAIEEWAVDRIIAFEPLAEAAEIYEELFRDDPQVRLERKALGSSAGQGTLHISAADDSSSLLVIGDQQLASFPGTQEVGTRDVGVVALGDVVDPDWISPPALLKIDVQGAELEVLRGCEELLSRFHWVLVEASFDELYEGQPLVDEMVRWMHAHGFDIQRIETSRNRGGIPVQADLLFTSSDEHDSGHAVPALDARDDRDDYAADIRSQEARRADH